jgi:hypothetical protein
MGLNRNLGQLTEVITESGGNIGINTINPTQKLDVNGNISLSFNGESRIVNDQRGTDSISIRGASNVNFCTFSTTSYLERMRIANNGNVLIGTTVDSGYKLEVDGFSAVKSGGFGGGGYILKSYPTGASRNWGVFNDQLAWGDFMITTSSTQTGVPNTSRIYINNLGNVGVGTDTPGYRLDVNGIIRSTALGGFAIGNTGGIPRIQLNNGNTFTFLAPADALAPIVAASFNTSSDYRLKQDLKPINGLNLVSQIKVYDYQWKIDETRAYGVLAHELQEIIPQAVNGEKDAEYMQGVDYSKLVPILVQAIQELKAEIEILKQNK